MPQQEHLAKQFSFANAHVLIEKRSAHLFDPTAAHGRAGLMPLYAITRHRTGSHGFPAGSHNR